MGCAGHNCILGSQRHSSSSSSSSSHLIMSLLFLLISTSTHFRITAEGRPVAKLVDKSSHVGEEEKAIIRGQIGSRPPRCERRCSSCGHCEAVQVPAVPLVKSNSKGIHFSTTTVSMMMRGGEDSSNYKPMSWKCKCGNMIFNP